MDGLPLREICLPLPPQCGDSRHMPRHVFVSKNGERWFWLSRVLTAEHLRINALPCRKPLQSDWFFEMGSNLVVYAGLDFWAKALVPPQWPGLHIMASLECIKAVLKDLLQSCVVVHTNSSPQEGKAGGSPWVQGQPGPHCLFQASQSHIIIPRLKKQKQQN